MQPTNDSIQSSAIDLLQAIVARGEIDAIVEDVEAIVVRKLYFCIHLGRLDLQNKLLHLLHSVISASTALDESSRQVNKEKQEGSAQNSATGHDGFSTARSYSGSSLLVQMLVDGIAVRTNRPVLQHWLDFLLMAVPQFQPALQAVVGPLNDCICRQLSASLRDVLHASSHGQNYTEDLPSFTTDAEMIMLLNGLERMVSLSLAYTSESSSSDEEAPIMEKPVSENSGLLGMVSNVFSSDSTQQAPEDQLTVSLTALAEYRVLIRFRP
jgi:hypothetical protein